MTADHPAPPPDARPPTRASVSAQDHLKVIWGATEWSASPVTTTQLANRLGLSPSTVSEQVRRLVDAGLVRHAPYGPVELTAAGEREALAVVRRHRLLETFLVAELGYAWDEVHDEAEVLEHVVSDVLLERIDAKLGNPSHDPHGDPIPSVDGAVSRLDARALSTFARGERGVVARVGDRDPAVLRWCEDAGLHLGALVEVVAPPGAQGGDVAVRITPGAAVTVPASAAAVVLLATPPRAAAS